MGVTVRAGAHFLLPVQLLLFWTSRQRGADWLRVVPMCWVDSGAALARRAGIGFVLYMAIAPVPALAQLEPDPGTPAVVDVQPRVERAFEAQERVPVFLILHDTETVATAQQAALALLGGEFEIGRRYRNIPVVAGVLSRAGLARLRAHGAVAAVQLDGTGSGGLAEALPAAGVDKVQSLRGLTGAGVTVAVLDSGASTQHPALQGAIVGQHCFTQFGCTPFSSEGESAEDDHNHGSNVTGIVASRGGGGVAKGYAPAAKIVAVKVLDRNNSGQVSDWVAGFDWVLSNLATHDVKVINASLCSTAEYATASACDAGESALAMITRRLIAEGVMITASSGNTGHTETMTAPACNSGVVAVGATYDSNLGRQPETGGTYRALGGSAWPACSDATTNSTTIACFTSTAGARLDLLAPGSQLSSAGVGTGKSLFRGTSQAAPGVAGLAALMLECNPMLTPTRILEVLKMTGQPVMDPRSNMTYPLIRGLEAVDMACPMGAAGSGGAAGAGSGGMGGMGGMVAAAGASGSMAAGMGGGRPAQGGSGMGSAGAASPAGGAGSGGMSGGGLTLGPTAGTLPIAGALPSSRVPAPDDGGCGCAVPGGSGPTRGAWSLLGAGAIVARLRRRSGKRARAD